MYCPSCNEPMRVDEARACSCVFHVCRACFEGVCRLCEAANAH